MKYGYARISDESQDLAPQIDALINAGVKKGNIYTDVSCKVNDKRDGFNELLSVLKTGDSVFVTSTNRIAKTVPHFCKLIEEWFNNGVRFTSLTEPFLETRGDDGEFVADILSCLANIDRSLVVERTNYGLTAAIKFGRKGGRKPGLSDSAKRKASLAKTLYEDYKNKMTIEEMMENLDIRSKATFYKYLRHAGINNPKGLKE